MRYEIHCAECRERWVFVGDTRNIKRILYEASLVDLEIAQHRMDHAIQKADKEFIC